MVRVSIVLESAMGSDRDRPLGEMEIDMIAGTGSTVNQSKGEVADYRYRIRKWTADRGIWKSGTVTGHNRRTRGPWDLLFLCLLDAVGERNLR